MNWDLDINPETIDKLCAAFGTEREAMRVLLQKRLEHIRVQVKWRAQTPLTDEEVKNYLATTVSMMYPTPRSFRQ